MQIRNPAHALLPAMLAAALLPAAPAVAQTSGPYVDVSGYVLDDARYEAWLGLRTSLRDDFDQICGDTFCEGEFSNIESLRFSCSVHRVTGRIGMCAWVFAASNEAIDPATGRITIAQRGFWRCRTPLVAGTTIEQFVDTLQVERPLYAPLPASGKTIMDGLIDCL